MRWRCAFALSTAILGASLLPSRANAQMVSLDVLDREFVRIVEAVAPAVVRVGPGFTGVCIAENGFVLTDGRVAETFKENPDVRAKGIAITFPDKRTFSAQWVSAHADTNTCLLKIDAKRLPFARPSEPDSVRVGQFLLSIGNAFDTAAESAPAVTLGIVAAVHRDASGRTTRIETSAATNPGQDGCPYFDVDGQLVGVFRQQPSLQDLALLTPMDQIRGAYEGVAGVADAFPPPRTVLPPRSRARALSTAFHAAAMRARSAVVTLVVTKATPAAEATATPGEGQAAPPPAEPSKPRDAPKGPPVLVREGAVTGTIVDAQGYVLAPSKQFPDDVVSIEAHTSDGKTYRASVLAHDRKAGLALLVLDKPRGTQFEVLESVATSGLQEGQFVIAVAAPHGPPATPDPFVTVGVVSALHRLDPWRDAIQTDAGTNVKNAGGVLVDLRGRLLGIVLSPEWPFGQNSGLGFAMPIDAVLAAVERLKSGTDVEPAYLGVTLNDVPSPAVGVAIAEVAKGMPAEKAGVMVGDLIVACDGKPMRDRRGFSDFMARSKCAGDAVELTLQRGDRSLVVVATLAKRP
ncbi:MAG: trypsin-like peptidase domain-containing protein [Planctomycetes bacterium]|nr:trypsin-like peptidase domain-containing protein [Planctomycetota bacterium]MCC7171617.1 trypsin-like peptidase domain-containing protein [Planctomycetota bacterium]